MDEFDPYHKWLGIAKKFRPPTLYHLLGIDPDETDREVIEEAALQRSAHLRSYQVGAHADLCTRLLNEIAAARLTLLNPTKRAAYDASLAPKAVPVAARPIRSTSDAAPPVEEFAFEAGAPRKPRSPSAGRKKGDAIDIRLPSARPTGGSMLPFYLLAGAVGAGLVALGIGLLGLLFFVGQAPMAIVVQAPAPPIAIEKPAPVVAPVIPQPRPKPAPIAPPVVAPPVVAAPIKAAPIVAPLPGDLVKLDWRQKPFRILPDTRVSLVALRPDGSLFVSTEKGLQAFDLTTGQKVRDWPYIADPSDTPWLSDDAKLLYFRNRANPGQTGPCVLLDLVADKIMAQGDYRLPAMAQFDVSADRKLGLCVSQKPHLIDLATGRELDALEVDARAAIFMPDSRYLLVASEKEVFEWDTKEDKRTKEYAPKFIRIERLKLSKDGKKAYLGSQGALQELDFASGQIRVLQGVGGHGFAIDPEQGRYAAVSDTNQLSIGDLASGKSLRQISTPVGSARTACFAFGGRAILVGGSRGIIGFPWELDVAGPSGQIFALKAKSPKKVQFLPRGDALVVAHEQGLDLVSVPGGEILANLLGQKSRVKSFDIAADGRTLAYIAEGEKRVYLVDLETLQPIGVCKGSQGVPRTILFSPDGKLLIATEDLSEFVREKEPGLRVWNAATREQVAEEKIPTNQVYGVAAFAPDGASYYAASFMGRDLRTYDVAPFRLRQARNVQLPSTIVVSKTVPWALVPENFRFKRIMLDGAPAVRLDKNPEISLRSGVFSADGKYLVVGSGKVHFLKLPDLAETATIEAFGAIECVDLSADGCFVAFTCADNTVRVFPGAGAKER
jgi:WD40 repeat protein